MPSFKVPQLLLLIAATTVFGCAGEVTDGADADTLSTHPLLVVQQSAAQDQETRSHASVWFLRLSDERDFPSASHLVTPSLELPPVGTCVALGADEQADSLPKVSRVELAYAGDVRVGAEGVAVPLTVRYFPNVADFISGVTYTLQDQKDLGVPFGALLTVRASGSNELEPMEASTESPTLPQGVRLNGVDFVRESVTSEKLTVTRDNPLVLDWTAGSAADVIYVDVDPVPAELSERVRCALADTGTGEIPTLALPESSEMNLSIHRYRDAVLKFDAGLVGMAYFDLSVSTRVRVAP